MNGPYNRAESRWIVGVRSETMTTPADGLPSIYRFADLTLDVARRRVTRQGQPIELKALDFDLLRFLVESAPNVVNADVLAEKVWGRHFVSPENVAQRVMLLRQSLADDANRPRYIETVRNKGYRLIPVVETRAGGATSRHAAAPLADSGRRRSAARGRPHRGRELLARRHGRTAAAVAELRRRAAVREPEPRPPTMPTSRRACRTRS